MDEMQQITYMQARILRLASEKWHMSIPSVMSLFIKGNVLAFIRECFDIFHVEGDAAVLEDVVKYLHHKGVELDEEIN